MNFRYAWLDAVDQFRHEHEDGFADAIARLVVAQSHMSEGGRKGGNRRNPETDDILAYLADGHSQGQAALKFDKSVGAIKQIAARDKKRVT